jgi:hypothetical protein
MTRIGPAHRRGISQSGFVFVTAVLFMAAVALNFTALSKGIHFKKTPVPQPREFRQIVPVMGKWMQVSLDKKLDKETQDILATDKYIYRDYIRVDLRGADFLVALAEPPAGAAPLHPASDAAAEAIRSKFAAAGFDQQVAMIQAGMKDKSWQELEDAATLIEMQNPAGVINVGLTYYTGLADTVAHIPDRCYIAAGYEPSSYQSPTWDVGTDAAGRKQPLQFRFINFEDQTGSQRVPKFVAYIFHTNGHYESDPLRVRQVLQSLTQRYGYYAKIELMTLGSDPQVAADTMTDFMSSSKPQIEACFPDWNALMHSLK